MSQDVGTVHVMLLIFVYLSQTYISLKTINILAELSKNETGYWVMLP